MDTQLIFVCFIIAVALVFDFTNGMHDAANSVATVVATRTLTPRKAVALAATGNFVAFLIFGTAVAKTVGKGMIDLSAVTPVVILAGLIGAIGWNLLTLQLGLPTSSSHALIGGYAGAAVSKVNFGVILWAGWTKTLIFIVLAPLIGYILGSIFICLSHWIIYWGGFSSHAVNTWSRRLQICSASVYSVAHGGNDAQKTMGIIAGILYSSHHITTFAIPLWVVLSAHTAIGLGTLLGGWRIMKTMGQGIAKLQPLDGVCAETASAVSIITATELGVPVSTTHVIAGAITGVASARRVSAVRWGLTLNIVLAWVLTIPGSFTVAWCSFKLFSLF